MQKNIIFKKIILSCFIFLSYAYCSLEWTEFSFVLKPSPLGGIGVFSTHDIAKGTQVFKGSFELRTLKTKDVPPELLKYCIHVNEEECLGPVRFDRMEIGWYMNHSDDPNVANEFVLTQETHLTIGPERKVFAVKDIKAGDEILIDYNALGEPEHLKDDYYKP